MTKAIDVRREVRRMYRAMRVSSKQGDDLSAINFGERCIELLKKSGSELLVMKIQKQLNALSAEPEGWDPRDNFGTMVTDVGRAAFHCTAETTYEDTL